MEPTDYTPTEGALFVGERFEDGPNGEPQRIIVLQVPQGRPRRDRGDVALLGLAALTAVAGIAALVCFLISLAAMAAAIVPTLGGVSLSVAVKRRKGGK